MKFSLVFWNDGRRYCKSNWDVNDATLNWVESLNVDVDETVIVGAYLTGMKLANRLKEISKVTVIDIHPILKSLLDKNIAFTDDLNRISSADLVIDTTGLGGLSPETVMERVSSDVNIFLVEDPTSEGSDSNILQKQYNAAIGSCKFQL